MSITIPHEKLTEILEECKVWSSRTSAMKKQLQSIAGKLQHIAKCVRPGRSFVNRVLAAVRTSLSVGSQPFEVEVLQDLGLFVRMIGSSSVRSTSHSMTQSF